jgi:integrase/recombinase XerD
VTVVQRARLPGSDRLVWLVVGDDHLPVEPIGRDLAYLDDVERSPNTLRAYAHHLKLFWDYLAWAKLAWTDVGLGQLARFMAWLRRYDPDVVPLGEAKTRRSESTVNTILAAVNSFYEFHERLGSLLPFERYRLGVRPSGATKPFLHHITKGQPVRTRLVKARSQRRLPRTLAPEDIEALLGACTHVRDQLLVCLLRDTGMRIGQVLGLRHADMVSWDNLIRIVPRNNVNQARTKSTDERVVDVFPSLMALYTRYLLEEYGELDSDYVFVNLWEGRIGAPMVYATVVAFFQRLQRRTGIYARPHMLRHTHATDLIRTGKWDLAYVAERLGHANIGTTGIYLHLQNADMKAALKDYAARRQGKAGAS